MKSNYYNKGLLGCFRLVLMLAVAGVSVFMVCQGWADPLYDGKISTIFEDNSSVLMDSTVLEEIVDQVKGDISINKLEFVLLCTTSFPEDAPDDFATRRVEALKDFFTTKLPGVEVEGRGESLNILREEDNRSVVPPVFTPDVLVVEGSSDGKNIRKTSEEELEEWNEGLRVRYEKILQQHTFLCEVDYDPPGVHEENCDSTDRKSLDQTLCRIRRNTYYLQYPKEGGGSIGSLEYNLDRLLKLVDTVGEVQAIADEIKERQRILEKKPDIKILLSREIKNQYLAIKHLKRALATSYKALETLSQMVKEESSLYDIEEKAYSYRNLCKIDELYAQNYSKISLGQNINKVRKLHNFVRTNLGLKELSKNGDFPVCVDTSFQPRTRMLEIEKIKVLEREAKVRARWNGITPLPL